MHSPDNSTESNHSEATTGNGPGFAYTALADKYAGGGAAKDRTRPTGTISCSPNYGQELCHRIRTCTED